jgi:hypothetical protein
MVIFSRWQPDGGYDYYEVSGYTAPLGDDLPNPPLPAATELGVPSVEAGHRIPVGARHVGEGELPRGVVAPMDTSRLGQLLPVCVPPFLWVLLAAGTGALATWAMMRERRRR